jgi:hypothetical protein
MQMEAPELYPAAVPSESHYLRRYHTYLLTPPTGEPRPPPASVLQWMEEQYQAQVTQPVSAVPAVVIAAIADATCQQQLWMLDVCFDLTCCRHPALRGPCRLRSCALQRSPHLALLEAALRSHWW